MPRRKRTTLLFLCAVTLAFACKQASKEEPKGTHPEAQIIDLSTSVADLQRDFDAHAGEARFVMLLSPT